MTSTGFNWNYPPHWLLELLGIFVGFVLLLPLWAGYVNEPSMVSDGAYMLLGGSIVGFIHDIGVTIVPITVAPPK